MSHRTWTTLCERVQNLSDPIRHSVALGWSCVGLAGGGILALLPWLAAYKQLTPDDKLEFSWITPAIVVTTIAAGVLGAYSFWIGRIIGEDRQRHARQVLPGTGHQYT